MASARLRPVAGHRACCYTPRMKSFSRTLVRGAFLSGAGTVVAMACGLGAAIVFTRALSPELVGVFSLLILATDVFVVVNNFGLAPSLPKLVAAARDDRRSSLVSSTLTFQALFSLALAAGAYVVWLGIGDPRTVSANPDWLAVFPYLWLVPPLVFAANLRDNAMAILAGRNRYGRRAAVMAGSAVVYAASVLVFVRFFQGGLMALAVVTLGFYGLAALWACSGAGFRPGSALKWRAYKEAIGFSWPLHLNAILSLVFLRLDTLFVFVLLGPAKAAFFELAAKRLPSYFARLMVAARTPFLPGIAALIARRDRDRAARLLNQTSNVSVFVGYACLLCMLAVQEPLILLLFPEEYLAGIPALGLVMASMVLAFQAGVMGQTLVALGKPRLVTLVNVGTAVVSVGANLLLIPWLGLVGAGWAAVIGTGISNGAQSWLVYRHGTGLSPRHYALGHFAFLLILPLLWLGDGIAWRLAAIGVFVLVNLWSGNIAPTLPRDVFRALTDAKPTHDSPADL
jgi:O-antigen/teichoic acid export membrane protein